MAGTDIALAITATDQATPVIQAVNAQLVQQGRAFDSATGNAAALERQWDKLTSGSELLAGGLSHLRRGLEGILFGGIVGAAEEITRGIISWAMETSKLADQEQLIKDTLGSKIGIIDQLTAGTKSLSSAEYALLQIEIQRRIIAEQEKIDTLKGTIQKQQEAIQTGNELLEQSRNTIIGSQMENQQLMELYGHTQTLTTSEAALAVEEEKLGRLYGLSGQSLAEFNSASIDAVKATEDNQVAIANWIVWVAQGEFKLKQANDELRRRIDLEIMLKKLMGDSTTINKPKDTGALTDGEKAALAAESKLLNEFQSHLSALNATTPFGKFFNQQQQQITALTGAWQTYFDWKEQADMTSAENQMRANMMAAQAVLGTMGALLSQLGGHSKAVFALQKSFAIAQSIINTAEGVTKALSMGPVIGPILATMIAAMGAAQIALIASTNPGATSYGGFGGGGGAGSGSAGNPISSGSNQQQGPPIIFNVNITAGAVDKHTIDLLMNQSMDSFAQILQDRNGVIGNVKMNYKRL